MKKLLTIGIFILLLLALAAFLDHLRTAQNMPGTEPPYGHTTIVVGNEPLELEIAVTDAQRERGLSGREALAPGTGMLFIFDEPGLHGFWMPDMHFPIDIAWLDDDFCLVTVEKAVSPDSYPTVYVPVAPARYVIETAAGFFGSHHVSRGMCLEKSSL